ncbi:CDP-diacylglycerol--glycerol-3-phosphate 3-phosphatidyltransferase [Pacificimonas flava]|uniref:CDP-diacylglycerol--glycerol-3-phosphate 3-phosphatidyltransferase n=2 Tax=Pacificimonas TaxID=1960290 RepID=A0A219B871_9SPHN|nr:MULTISPECIES: CDP-diacylglycerol--glycerol-3-phosphate 3-phosphatidyltransferase [Pacificimonas]MBZ6379938.1 CDP-diacylglycerol--glycerol-3-phosphate 3-phosphatidyltransferase [Pacificimonas aurantium]OWV34461.1 CDP-diacylglycerol--glycerol-3-phosphate 3-phosphatidyltransferase [Pacificimonas flava]
MTSLPNLLTLSRLFAVPILVICMWQAGWLGYLIAYILFCLAGATDYLDGYLARSQGTVSKLGQFLDPIADKIMVGATIVMLIENDIVDGYATIAALIILLREIIVSGLREFLAGVQVSVPVSRLAKWKTAFQMIALGALILEGFAMRVMPALPAWEVGIVCLWLAAAMTTITGYDYLRAGLKHMV